MKNKSALSKPETTASTTPSPCLDPVANSDSPTLHPPRLEFPTERISTETPCDGSILSLGTKGKRQRPESRKFRSGKWTEEEHRLFLEAIELYGNVWKNVESYVGTRTCAQIRSHSQKYFQGVRAKALEELRRTNQLKNKVFIVVKEYRNYTGSQTSTGVIENFSSSPKCVIEGEVKLDQLVDSQKILDDVPPLLLDGKDELRSTAGGAAGAVSSSSEMYQDDEGQQQRIEELNIELIRGIEDVQPEADFLLGKFTPLDDAVQDIMFPYYAAVGEVIPEGYTECYEQKHKNYDTDAASGECIDCNSLLMKFNGDQ